MNKAVFNSCVLVHARKEASSRRATRPCILNARQADELAQGLEEVKFGSRPIEKATHDGQGTFEITYTGGGNGNTKMLNEIDLLGGIIGDPEMDAELLNPLREMQKAASESEGAGHMA